jgi:PDZ domain
MSTERTYTMPQSRLMPPGTTEIPQAMSGKGPAGVQSGSSEANGETVNYETSQDPRLIEPQLRSLQEFIAEGENTSPLGLQLREARRGLNDGEEADGLLITDVIKGSPAEKAGLHGYRQTTHAVLETAAVAASLFFPPAVLTLPIIDQIHVGESYDMIIGVDGSRVANFMDFEDHMRDVQPGDVVYLSIVRNGKRVQVPIKIPKLSTAASAPPY